MCAWASARAMPVMASPRPPVFARGNASAATMRILVVAMLAPESAEGLGNRGHVRKTRPYASGMPGAAPARARHGRGPWRRLRSLPVGANPLRYAFCAPFCNHWPDTGWGGACASPGGSRPRQRPAGPGTGAPARTARDSRAPRPAPRPPAAAGTGPPRRSLRWCPGRPAPGSPPPRSWCTAGCPAPSDRRLCPAAAHT